MRLLLVEDDRMLADGIKQGLATAGYVVDAVGSAEEALDALTSDEFDAAIIDIGLPNMDGMELTQRLRQRGQDMPVLMLTARAALQDRVQGLDAGADDYMVKPFDLPELLARLRALLRRPAHQEAAVLQHGELSIDAHARTVRWRGQDVALTPKEYALLELLLRRQGATLSRAQIFEHLYDSRSDASDKVVEVIMSTLRTKLAPLGLGDLIVTRRGFGYSIP